MPSRSWVVCVLLSCALQGCGNRPETKAGEAGSAAGVVRLEPADLAGWLNGEGERFLVDLREPEAFAKRHVAGAINLQSDYSQFEIRAARFFGPKAHLCLMSDDPDEARRLAATVGGDRQVGWLARPVSEAQGSEAMGLAHATQRTITAREAAQLVESGKALLIDARTASEYAAGHVPGALFVYPDDFPRQAGFLRRDRPVIVVCEAGWRSSLLVSFLDRAGFEQAFNLMEGMQAWRRDELPLEAGGAQKAFGR